MEFGTPVKLQDGRRFLKIQGCTIQLNNVKVQEGLGVSSPTFELPESLH